MNSTSRNVLASLGAAASVVFVIAACGSDPDSTFGNGSNDSDSGLGGQGFQSEAGFGNATPDSGDPFANDPPPTYCVLAGQPEPPRPGGTPECPDDKNKPGCSCNTVGEEAACWTGLRINRKLGQCKDGKTKCLQISETQKAWGPCEGQVLPTPGQTKGKAACKCFSLGQWNISNLSPCFITYGAPASGTYAVSTVTDGSGPNKLPIGQSDCPTIPQNMPPPPPKPTSDWATDTLTVDCAGRFELCYQLKAGDAKAPKPTDCAVMDKVCVTADYLKENVAQPFPNLGAWTGNDPACAAQFQATGGYGEMSVKGESILCDKIDDGAGNSYVFNRVQYCPMKCNEAANKSDPECVNCKQDGSGTF